MSKEAALACSGLSAGTRCSPLLPHLAAQSGIAQEASRGMNPGVSGTLTLLQKAWSCGRGSYLHADWGARGQSHVRAGSGEGEVGVDPAGPRWPKAAGLERCRTEAIRGLGIMMYI